MASGTSSSVAYRANNNNSGFDFASDDVLCSYDDLTTSRENPNGAAYSDSAIGAATPNKDFLKTRLSRSAVFPPPNNGYAQLEDSSKQELMDTVDRTMKKYVDNLMRFLEGISSRLSQLELYCYNLDKSIGEMRADLVKDHEEVDAKLKSVDKHLQEVHRSVQILRDKQELAETQRELAKLQVAQRESSPEGDHDDDASNLQLALALPHPVATAPQPSHLTRAAPEQRQSVSPPIQAPPQMITSQQPSYYLSSSPLPNQTTQSHPQPQPRQGQYLTTADSQFRVQQLSANPQQSQVSQSPPQVQQQFPQYQQQWGHQQQQPVHSNVLPSPPQVQTQTQIRVSSSPHPSNVYSTYISSQQPSNPLPQESLSSSMPMQMPVSGITQQGVSNGYAWAAGDPLHSQLPPPQHMNLSPPVSHPAITSGGSSYMFYDSDVPRQHHPSTVHFSQGGGGGYSPPSSASVHSGSSGLMIRSQNPQRLVQNHPYNELIDKMVSMGYRGDHVVGVIQMLEESGQPVDFNSVLDGLIGHTSGVSQRGW